MSSNQIGKHFSVVSYGESHGEEIGVIVDGVPAGLLVDLNQIQKQLNRRRPGQSELTTDRNEGDELIISSGLHDGKTTGAPVCMRILNTNQRSSDYKKIENVFRPSHSDFTYANKYGTQNLPGGGRSSARITAGWVAAGALAEQLIQHYYPIQVIAWVDSVHQIQMPEMEINSRDDVDATPVRCPHPETAHKIARLIEETKKGKDSLGGTIRLKIENCPVGLGDPVFQKLNAELSHAFFNLNAVKGVEFGGGFDLSKRLGSEVNDEWTIINGEPTTQTNHSGGIQAGISNGMPITVRIGFKPTSSIGLEQQTIDTDGNPVTIKIDGRHDPCVLPRAVPIIESLAAIVLINAILENKNSTL